MKLYDMWDDLKEWAILNGYKDVVRKMEELEEEHE